MKDWEHDYFGRGGWWVAGQLALTAAVLALGPLFPREDGWRSRTAGGLLVGLSALTGVLGVVAQGRRLSPFPRPGKDTELIQHGIYAWVRHPLYTCNLCAFFGWALLWGSLAAGAVAVLSAVFFQAKAWREESWLCERFPEYPAYQKRVKGFIPWVW
jgi:protein-S-isoprenylcysteine O-methyltransferase Ste14